MTVDQDKDADRQAGEASEPQTPRKPPVKKKSPGNPELGGALRSIYQRTVDERIPPDLLDLLGKLG